MKELMLRLKVEFNEWLLILLGLHVHLVKKPVEKCDIHASPKIERKWDAFEQSLRDFIKSVNVESINKE
jgi:hypothetical protein